jgi:polar amino acid transport system substrate-binding protein
MKEIINMKRFLWPLLAIMVIASLSLSACSNSNNKVFTVATDATWPPFEYVDEQGNIVGFDIDLMNAIAEEAGIEIKYENVGFDALLAGMAQGTYDMAISSITIKPERAENMLFSDPYYLAGQMIVVQKSNTTIADKTGLTGKKLGAQLGTTGESEAQSIAGATVKSYNQIGLAIQDLLNGQIDAVICDTPIAEGYVNKNINSLKIVGNALTEENYGIALSKDNTDLLTKINKALKTVKDQGIIDQLIEKWLAS